MACWRFLCKKYWCSPCCIVLKHSNTSTQCLFSVPTLYPSQMHLNKGPFFNFSFQVQYLWLLYGMKSFLGYLETSNPEIWEHYMKKVFSTSADIKLSENCWQTSVPSLCCIFRFHVWNIWPPHTLTTLYSNNNFVNAYWDFEEICHHFQLSHMNVKNC